MAQEKDQATVGIEVVVNYDAADLKNAVGTVPEQIASAVVTETEKYIKTAGAQINAALNRLKSAFNDGLVGDDLIDSIQSQASEFKRLKDALRTPASKTDLTSDISKAIEFVNEVQNQVRAIGANINLAVDAVSYISEPISKLNKAIATFSEQVHTVANGSLKAVRPAPIQVVSPELAAVQADTVKQQIEAVKGSTAAFTEMKKVTELLLETFAQDLDQVKRGVSIGEQLRTVGVEMRDVVSKYVVYDLETGAHIVKDAMQAKADELMGIRVGGLELPTSMAFKPVGGESNAFKVDFSNANFLTDFFDKYLKNELDALPLKDMATELRGLFDTMQSNGQRLAGFNNSSFDTSVLLGAIKELKDPSLTAQFLDLQKSELDVRKGMLEFLHSELPRLFTSVDESQYKLGTSLDAFRAITMQINQSHAAADDVAVTELALIATNTAQGREVLSDIWRNQGGFDRWKAYVDAALVDKYNTKAPLKAIGGMGLDDGTAEQLVSLIKAMGGIKNFDYGELEQQGIPDEYLTLLTDLSNNMRLQRDAERRLYDDRIRASQDYLKQLALERAAAVQVVEEGTATVQAITRLSIALKGLGNALGEVYGKAQAFPKGEIDTLLSQNNTGLPVDKVEGVRGAINNVFDALIHGIDRELSVHEVEDILARTRKLTHEVFDSVAQAAEDRTAILTKKKKKRDNLSEEEEYKQTKTEERFGLGVKVRTQAQLEALVPTVVTDSTAVRVVSETLVDALNQSINGFLKSNRVGLAPRNWTDRLDVAESGTANNASLEAAEEFSNIPIQEGEIAKDAVEFAKLLNSELRRVHGDLQQLYVFISQGAARIDSQFKVPPIVDAASKFFGVVDGLGALFKFLTTFDSLPQGFDMATVLSDMRGQIASMPDTQKFNDFITTVSTRTKAAVDLVKAEQALLDKIKATTNKDTLRSLMPALSALEYEGSNTDIEYIKGLEGLVAPVKALVVDIKKAAAKSGEATSTLVDATDEYLSDLDRMVREMTRLKNNARQQMINRDELASSGGEGDKELSEKAFETARRSFRLSLATRLKYMKALERFVQNVDDVTAQLQAEMPDDAATIAKGHAHGKDIKTRLVEQAADLGERLASALFSPDIFKEVMTVYKRALAQGMSSLPGLSLTDVASSVGQMPTNTLGEVHQQLSYVQDLTDLLAKLELQNDLTRSRVSAETDLAVAQERLIALDTALNDVRSAQASIAQIQVGAEQRRTAFVAGGGQTPPPPGSVVPYAAAGAEGEPGEPHIVGTEWDELSKKYTTSIATASMENELYGESLDRVRVKESATAAELERIMKLLGSTIGNRFLSDEEIAFKRLSEEIQGSTAQIERFQRLAQGSYQRAETLKVQAAATQITGEGDTGRLLKQADAATILGDQFKKRYEELRDELAAQDLEATLEDMSSALKKMFSGDFDFSSSEVLDQAREKIGQQLKHTQENLMQKLVESFASIEASGLDTQGLKSALSLNSQAFKSGVTQTPFTGQSLTDMIPGMQLSPESTTGKLFDEAGIQAVLEKLGGVNTVMGDIKTGAKGVDEVIAQAVANLGHLVGELGETGKFELVNELKAAEQEFQLTLAEARAYEAVIGNIREQVAALDKALNKEGLTQEEITGLVEQQQSAYAALNDAMAQLSLSAEKSQANLQQLVETARAFKIDYRSQEAQEAALSTARKNFANEDEALVRKKIELQAKYLATIERTAEVDAVTGEKRRETARVDEKLVRDLIELNKRLAQTKQAPVGLSDEQILKDTPLQSKRTVASQKFTLDVLDFTVWQMEWSAAFTIVQTFFDAFAKGVMAIKEYDDTIVKMAAITQTSAGEIGKLSNMMLDLTENAPIGIKDLGEALADLGKAGFTASESMTILPNIVNLAVAAMVPLKDATTVALAAMEAFDIPAGRSVQVVDELASASVASKLSVDQLTKSFGMVAPVASAAGMSLTDTNTALALLANAGLRAEVGGTALRTMIASLMNPSAKLQKQLEDVGLTTEDVNLRFHSLGEVLSVMQKHGFDVEHAFEGMSQKMLVGLVAMVNNADKWGELKSRIEHGVTAAELADEQMGSLGDSTKMLANSLGSLSIAVGGSTVGSLITLENTLSKVLKGVINFVNWIPDWFKSFVLITTGTSMVASSIKSLYSGLTAVTGVTITSGLKSIYDMLKAMAGLKVGTQIAEGVGGAAAAVTELSPRLAKLKEQLHSLSSIVFNPELMLPIAAIVGGGMALNSYVNTASGLDDYENSKKVQGYTEGRIEQLRNLTSGYNPAEPSNSRGNSDIQAALYKAGFKFDLKDLDDWVTHFEAVNIRLKEVTAQNKLTVDTSWWTSVKTWFQGWFDDNAEMNAKATVVRSTVNLLKERNQFYQDEPAFSSALAQVRKEHPSIDDEAAVAVTKQYYDGQSESDVSQKRLDEDRNGLLSAYKKLQDSSSALERLKGFNLKDDKQLADASAFMKSIGYSAWTYNPLLDWTSSVDWSTDGSKSDQREAIKAALDTGSYENKDFTKLLQEKDMDPAALKTEVRARLAKLRADRVSQGTMGFGMDDSIRKAQADEFKYNKLQQQITDHANDESEPGQAIYENAKAELEKMLPSFKTHVSEALLKFFNRSLSSGMEGMLKSLAAVSESEGSQDMSQIANLPLQALKDFQSKTESLRTEISGLAGLIEKTPEMQFEAGTNALEGRSEQERAALLAGVKPNVDRIAVLQEIKGNELQASIAAGKTPDMAKNLKQAAIEEQARAQAEVEALGKQTLFMQLKLYWKLREDDISDESHIEGAKYAKKRFDEMQSAMDEVSKTKVLELKAKTDATIYSNSMTTQLANLEKEMAGFGRSAEQYMNMGTAAAASQVMYLMPSFTAAQASLEQFRTELNNSKLAYDGVAAQYKESSQQLEADHSDKLKSIEQMLNRGKANERQAHEETLKENKAYYDKKRQLDQGYVSDLQKEMDKQLKLYEAAVSKYKEAEMAGKDLFNSIMSLARKAAPPAALTASEVGQKASSLSYDITTAARRGNFDTAKELESQLSNLISENSEVIKSDQMLSQSLQGLAYDAKAAADSWKRQQQEGADEAKKRLDATRPELDRANNTLKLDTGKEKDNAQAMYNDAKSKYENELAAMLETPKAINEGLKAASQGLSDGILAATVNMKTLAEQTQQLAATMAKVLPAGATSPNIAKPSGPAPATTPFSGKLDVSGTVQLINGDQVRNLSPADVNKVVDAVTDKLVNGLTQ